MNEHDDEDRLLEQVARLPREIPPARDLWPQIECALGDRIPAETGGGLRQRWQTPLALAAGLILALGIGFWAGRSQPVNPVGPTVAGPATVVEHEAAGLQTVYLTERAGLLDARRTMAAEIEAGLSRLPPDARVVVLDNLRAINRALDEIDAALNQAPASGLDRHMLMAMYVDQLGLLGNVQHLVLQTNQEILL